MGSLLAAGLHSASEETAKLPEDAHANHYKCLQVAFIAYAGFIVTLCGLMIWLHCDKSVQRVAEPESITQLLESDEVLAVVLFFSVSSVLLMTFDNIHYCFLIDTAKLTTAQYDVLRILPHLGVALGTLCFLNWFSHM